MATCHDAIPAADSIVPVLRDHPRNCVGVADVHNCGLLISRDLDHGDHDIGHTVSSNVNLHPVCIVTLPRLLIGIQVIMEGIFGDLPSHQHKHCTGPCGAVVVLDSNGVARQEGVAEAFPVLLLSAARVQLLITGPAVTMRPVPIGHGPVSSGVGGTHQSAALRDRHPGTLACLHDRATVGPTQWVHGQAGAHEAQSRACLPDVVSGSVAWAAGCDEERIREVRVTLV